MKLYVSRAQAGRMIDGGVRFELYVQVDLTEEESALVKQYQAYAEELLTKRSWAGVQSLTIGSLIKGQRFKSTNIGEMLHYEEAVKEACRTFKTYLVTMKNFGGRETFEY